MISLMLVLNNLLEPILSPSLSFPQFESNQGHQRMNSYRAHCDIIRVFQLQYRILNELKLSCFVQFEDKMASYYTFLTEQSATFYVLTK